MRTWKILGPAVAGALVLTSVSPVVAEETDGAEVESGDLEVEVDRRTVMLGDEIEVEASFERELEEDDENESPDETDELDEDDGDDTDSDTDDTDDTDSDDTDSDSDSDTVEATEAAGLPTSVSFTVDLGDGSGVQELPVTELEADDEEFEAEAEGQFTYSAVGDHELTVVATPDVGESVSVTVPVSVTTDPVAYPRDPEAVCPEGLTVPSRFADVIPGSPHTAMIDCLATRGLVKGRSSAAFNPAADVSRAQMASFLVRLLEDAGVDLPEDAEDAFEDDEGSVHEEALDQLAAAGLLTGTGDGEVHPNDALTRAQMASLLVRAIRDGAGVELNAGVDYFADDAGSVHEEAINLAAAAGITTGRRVLEYGPSAHLSRGQLASFLARTLDLLLAEEEPAV